MGTKLSSVLYFLAMVIIIVGVDVIFLRHNAVARLLSNIGIVLVFIALYFAYLRH